ncbi:hypothetical protein A9236_09165 [Polynucleobacter sp. QLW-P1DATA-2]|uniref:bestrophin-like domain n=1 Tax=unclassified Polynucleobacter TaxID=2640945 RepID=UPI0008F7FAD8|nr:MULTISPECIES: DUF4239 domain-containing protein [unclassified Polynucleobacter]OIN01303.1 hypothetical protein A9236_09165 [Polynucleobacter sp. QLW-P1DATA-2]OIN02873.1 hypothetical protein A9235_04210 [Polynucleobacter sp. MWH-Tro8-2-5-gr]
MINYLHALPNIVIGLSIMFIGLLLSTAIPCYIRWKYDLNPSEHLAKGAEEGFKLFTSITLLLIAFSLVRVQGDHRNVEDLVSREAALMFKLNRSLAAFGGPNATELQGDLKNYADAIVDDEWPLMAKNERSEQASNDLTDLTQGIRLLDPRNPVQQMARAEIVTTLNQLSDVREARLSATRLQLPSYLWQALSVSVILLIIFGWLQNPLPKMVAYVGGVTIGVSVLFTLVIALEGLFVGESRVTPEAIVHILPSLGA